MKKVINKVKIVKMKINFYKLRFLDKKNKNLKLRLIKLIKRNQKCSRIMNIKLVSNKDVINRLEKGRKSKEVKVLVMKEYNQS